jgi:hypothetical protein
MLAILHRFGDAGHMRRGGGGNQYRVEVGFTELAVVIEPVGDVVVGRPLLCQVGPQVTTGDDFAFLVVQKNIRDSRAAPQTRDSDP